MKLFIITVLLASTLPRLQAADSSIDPTLSYTITCRDSEKPWIENFMKLALRKHSVSTSTNGDFHLWVLAQPTGVANTSTGFYHTGYAVGFAVTRPVPTNYSGCLTEGIGSHSSVQEVTACESLGRMEFVFQGIETCFLGGLQNACESMIERVNSMALGVERSLRKARDEAKKAKK
jgi:hypothetical protein